MSNPPNTPDPPSTDPTRSRVYRPPINRERHANEAARPSWLRARTALAVVAGVLALGSLSVAGAHWFSSAVPMLSPAPVATPAVASQPIDVAAANTSQPAPSPTADSNAQLATLFDAAGADVTLDLTFGEAHQTLHRSDLAELVTRDGRSTRPDDGALQALTARLAKDWNQQMVNARFNWNGGNLTPIRESQEGRTLDQAAAATAIGQALLSGQRTVSLPGAIVPPQVSSADPQSLGITTNLDRGGTSFAGSLPEKAQNIKLAADRLNGVVVPPGGTFSFNQEVGPTTLDSGFQWGFGIEASANGGARTVPSVAGGICQVATTLFQRVFWSGFPLVERHWHLYWIPAYTTRGLVGLDATVDEDSGLDFRWSNPTDDYVLIQSATDESNVYFGIYGTQHNWKIKVDDPQVSHRVAADPAPVAEAAPTLPWGRIQPVETARDGFDVSITRTVTREDGQPRALTVQSSYEPSRTVTLVGTRDKPANADVDAILARIAPPPTRAPAVVAVSPTAVEANAPVPGGAGLAGESPASASPTVPAKPEGGTQPTPTTAPASSGGATPTAVSNRPPASATPAPAPAQSTATSAAQASTPTRAATQAAATATAGPPTATPRGSQPTNTPTRR